MVRIGLADSKDPFCSGGPKSGQRMNGTMLFLAARAIALISFVVDGLASQLIKMDNAPAASRTLLTTIGAGG